MPFFSQFTGRRPALLGVVLVILRARAAISDPLVGGLSDNARPRRGRRRPFMVADIVSTALLLYPLFWHMSAGVGETAKVVYLVGIGIVYPTCFTVWAMPCHGLQLKLKPNRDERTRLTGWMPLFSHSWFFKRSLTCAMGVGGFVLLVSGFDARLGAQPPGVISRMFGLYFALPIVIGGIATALRYPLNRARLKEIRATLESPPWHPLASDPPPRCRQRGAVPPK